jgi:hypothetical protein
MAESLNFKDVIGYEKDKIFFLENETAEGPQN